MSDSVYPTSIDAPPPTTPADPMVAPSHGQLHQLISDAIVAIETALGITGAFNFAQLTGTQFEDAVRANTPNQMAGLSGPINANGNKAFVGGAAGDQNGDGVIFGQSGTLVGARTIYSPTSPYVKSPASATTVAAIDTTNLTVTFNAPPSGNVLVEVDLPAVGFVGAAALDQALYLCLVTHGTTTIVSEWVVAYAMTVTGSGINFYGSPLRRYILVPGLTAGANYHLDLAWASSTTGGDMFVQAQSLTSTTPADGSIILTPVAA